MSVQENYNKIKQDIQQAANKVGRDPEQIRIIAVTKYVSIETAQAAVAAGIRDIGENRDTGLLQKYEAIGKEVMWHFIGTLQTRKVKNIIDKVDYIHSLDRMSLAEEIEKRATKTVKCFVQVNASKELTKHGLDIEEVIPYIKELGQFRFIEVVGLMTMAENTDDELIIRQTFQRLKKLQLEVQALQLKHAPCTELSMGMSNDYHIAIEEGATFIRIGTSLVGKEF